MDNKNVVNAILHVYNVMEVNKMNALNVEKIRSLKMDSAKLVLMLKNFI
jgi:hypothetical protein